MRWIRCCTWCSGALAAILMTMGLLLVLRGNLPGDRRVGFLAGPARFLDDAPENVCDISGTHRPRVLRAHPLDDLHFASAVIQWQVPRFLDFRQVAGKSGPAAEQAQQFVIEAVDLVSPFLHLFPRVVNRSVHVSTPKKQKPPPRGRRGLPNL